MTVLIVHNQEAVLDFVSYQRLCAGYQVVVCQSAEEAVDTLNSQPAGLVLTNMKMGALTGEDVLGRVRKEFGSIPVVLVSGSCNNLEKKDSDGYLREPVSMQYDWHRWKGSGVRSYARLWEKLRLSRNTFDIDPIAILISALAPISAPCCS